MKDTGIVVIGGGVFGCTLALSYSRSMPVVLIEKDSDLFQRASYANQARVHTGPHYPRSVLTGLRSRINSPRFLRDFEACVERSFEHYYAIARAQSKVNAVQFETFCRRIGAPLANAPAQVQRWFDPSMIEAVYRVEEFVFDASKLREQFRRLLADAGVTLWLDTEAQLVARDASGRGLTVSYRNKDGDTGAIRAARYVFNCSYSGINHLLARSRLQTIPLRHEITELALIEPPPELKSIAVTVMCGPFFSTMPFPPLGCHSLSHVRYTPHCSWRDGQVGASADQLKRKSRFVHMVKDAQRYMPILAGARHRDSLWEVKTVLPQSEYNDSRPILFKRDDQLSQLISVMGGKVDNIYDLDLELSRLEPGGENCPLPTVSFQS